MSRYRLQIVDLETGRVVVGNIEPGRERGEVDVIARVRARVKSRGVGLLRSEQHVLDAVDAALIDVFQEAKDRV